MTLSTVNCVRQRGFSLIELMIAMVLGLFVLASLLALFIGNNQSHRTQEAAARLQENARFALDILNREARKTGYRAAFTTMNTAFPAAAAGSVEEDQCVENGSFLTDGQVIFGADTCLALRYQGSGTGGGDGWMQDCLGANVAEGATVAVTLSRNGQNLQCSVNGGAARALFGGLQDLRFTYGVDTNNDSYADAYVAAGAVANWTRIASVRIELLLVTADDGLADAPQPYTFNGATVTPTDGRLRRVYSNMIGFRNLLP
jgi:type IV pilus assembly protein PilW